MKKFIYWITFPFILIFGFVLALVALLCQDILDLFSQWEEYCFDLCNDPNNLEETLKGKE